MALEGTYEPSPWPPIADQVALYESSKGADGNLLEGQPCVILWTRGRHSGVVRKSPLMRVTDDAGRYAVVASMGGAPNHPVWYLNLVADPEVSLQDGGELKDYTARVVEGDEKAEWWKRATAVWPSYDEYQTKTDRAIPLIVLDPR
ncbi:MAG: nitroreductase family deazaflavin-dependent oxidoreductase [Acidimicrobiia bacterium]|nr:nitroreductase family deazaflavin-dependent oxidoreductase [Acidimicrobiia bacterium]